MCKRRSCKVTQAHLVGFFSSIFQFSERNRVSRIYELLLSEIPSWPFFVLKHFSENKHLFSHLRQVRKDISLKKRFHRIELRMLRFNHKPHSSKPAYHLFFSIIYGLITLTNSRRTMRVPQALSLPSQLYVSLDSSAAHIILESNLELNKMLSKQ